MALMLNVFFHPLFALPILPQLKFSSCSHLCHVYQHSPSLEHNTALGEGNHNLITLVLQNSGFRKCK